MTGRLGAALLLLSLVSSCDRPARRGDGPTASETVVATVGSEAIAAADAAVPPGTTAEQRRRALDRVIGRTLAASEARRRGLAERPEVAEQLAAIEREAKERQGAVLREALLTSLREGLALSDEALRAHYEATKLRYAERQLRVLRHGFPSRQAAEDALVRGALSGEGAESLGPAAVGKLPRTVLPEALRLERPGARAVAGSEEEGWSVIELVEVLPAEPRPFEEVRGDVERSLRTLEGERALRRLLEELRAKAEVEIDEEALARVTPAEEPRRGARR